jgi:hypothetical protein
MMLNTKIKTLSNMCHPEVFKRLPIHEITHFDIFHDRIFPKTYKASGGVAAFAAKGGKTRVILIIANKEYIGISVCSKSDNYCKRTGRELALKRAIRKYWDSLKND